jgi:CDP-glucose 4,6-dehydratase
MGVRPGAVENLDVIHQPFWTKRRVLVTGHTGFVGSWLCIMLHELGAEVFGYALPPPTTPSLFAEARLANRLTRHEVADVGDGQYLRRFVSEVQPDIVFHLAAQPLVLRSYREPDLTWTTNVMGTVNLLEAVRAVKSVRVLQVFTSDKCYENRELGRPFRETDPLGGADPYSASKAAAELVVASWRASYFTDDAQTSIATVRAGNIIGGGDWAADRLVPDCIRALEAGQPIAIRAPQSVRPWQHVLDAISAMVALAQAQGSEPHRFAQSFNVGPNHDQAITVEQIVKLIENLWNIGPREPHRSVANNSGWPEAHHLRLDCSKIMSMLNWRPRRNVEQTVAETTEWYRRRHECGQSFNAWEECRAAVTRQLEVAA